MLFHKQLGLPAAASNLFGRAFRLQYSQHAKMEPNMKNSKDRDGPQRVK